MTSINPNTRQLGIIQGEGTQGKGKLHNSVETEALLF